LSRYQESFEVTKSFQSEILIQGNPGRKVGMDNAVIAGEKTEEAKSKTDPVRVMDVAINRSARFVSACPFTY
jgi:hypothetical protein